MRKMKGSVRSTTYRQTMQNMKNMATLGEDASLDSRMSFNGTEGTVTTFKPPMNISIDSSNVSTPKSKRRESIYETDTGELFAQTIQVRSKHRAQPSRRGFLSRLQSRKSVSEEATPDTFNENTPQDIMGNQARQYTVTVTKKTSTYRKIINLVNPDNYVYFPNKVVLNYVNWIFGASVTTVFFTFMLGYFILCLIFALFLKLAGDVSPECIIIGGEMYGTESSTTFSDSFHLSWTTFTTVGYGGAYASTGTEHANQWDCVFVTFLCTFESFTGLLYAGFCTAILFSKLQRIQSHAQVSFSNAICIQLGTFVSPNARVQKNEGDSSRSFGDTPSTRSLDTEVQSSETMNKLACPILKFQLVNQLANLPGGDILDASINVVGRKEGGLSKETVARYVRVRMQESNHPFFTRVWHCTHVLNENSRLLSPETRKAIAKNNGYWPDDISSPKAIEDALKFDKIIITLTGICDLSATPVQVAKRYNKKDVMIGYDFASMVYKVEGRSSLQVDMNLVNDIVEQYGTQHSILEDKDDENDDTHLTITQRNI